MLFDELQDAHQRLSAVLNGAFDVACPLTLSAIDSVNKCLLIGINELQAEAVVRSLFKDQVGDLPLSVKCLQFRLHGKQQRNRPISGGLKIVYPEGGNLGVGSIGVIAKRDNVLGFVTAGHVVDKIGTKVYQPSKSDNNRVGETKVVSNWKGSANSDSAFVEAEYSRRDEPKVGTIWKDDNSFYEVSQSGVAKVGDQVIMSGQNNNTGTENGEVIVVGATVRFTGGSTLNNQVITDYKTIEGDSGGAVFKIDSGNKVVLLGINVAGSDKQYITPSPSPSKPPNPFNNLYGVYSPWQSLEQDLGGTWVIKA
ncbi:MAG: hypothetical protein F6K36_16970 [Symploca sp. SIO3C6]|uniref:Trypsin-like peptidase domain-containing protein n=1 Tax=Symploca sp. SIO1C4 TaxID=2607765 RepID=A0A6B3N5V9_9CYAN|nr:hypothetical protein [Symploca sp. SIO3C6]NER28519.1 hypothetical protein [Symploca sp. SIO1C4]NET03543.1 hypothetical protein [Symploca sp. SIO2B6]